MDQHVTNICNNSMHNKSSEELFCDCGCQGHFYFTDLCLHLEDISVHQNNDVLSLASGSLVLCVCTRSKLFISSLIFVHQLLVLPSAMCCSSRRFLAYLAIDPVSAIITSHPHHAVTKIFDIQLSHSRG